jgi:hypothetical protein
MLSKRILAKLDVKCMFYCSAAPQNELVTKSTSNPTFRTKPEKVKPIVSTVREHLIASNAEYLFPHIPQNLMKRCTKGRSSSFLITPTGATNFVSLISTELLKDPSYVIECNPGLGIVTEELLRVKIPRIHLYEKYQDFVKLSTPLMKLLSKYPNSLEIRNLDFFSIWDLLLHDIFYNENFSQDYLVDIPAKRLEDSCFAQIIGYCADRKFLYMLCKNLAFQTPLFDLGRPKFFLAIPNDICNVSKKKSQIKIEI